MSIINAARTFTAVRALTNDDIRRAAPSVFAATPWHAQSDRYKFIPIIEGVDVLRDRCFLPTRATQSTSRIEGKGDFTKHMIRFRHVDAFPAVGPGPRSGLVVGAEIPELVLVVR
jgi:hypothetical protein